MNERRAARRAGRSRGRDASGGNAVRENGGTTTRGVTARVGVRPLRMATSFQKKQVAGLNLSMTSLGFDFSTSFSERCSIGHSLPYSRATGMSLKPAPASLRDLPRAPPGALPPAPGGYGGGLPPAPGRGGYAPPPGGGYGGGAPRPTTQLPPRGGTGGGGGPQHPTGLPPNLLALFEPRPPLEYMPPPARPKKTLALTGIAALVGEFEDPKRGRTNRKKRRSRGPSPTSPSTTRSSRSGRVRSGACSPSPAARW